MKRNWKLAWLLACIALATGRLQGQTVDPKVSLIGHDRVLINTITNDVVSDLGVRADTLAQFVLRRFAMENIEAVAIIEARLDDSLYLTFTIDAEKVAAVSGLYIYMVQAMAMQRAVLVQSGRYVVPVTWEQSTYGLATSENTQIIRDSVEDAIGKFVEDWNTAQKMAIEPAGG